MKGRKVAETGAKVAWHLTTTAEVAWREGEAAGHLAAREGKVASRMAAREEKVASQMTAREEKAAWLTPAREEGAVQQHQKPLPREGRRRAPEAVLAAVA